MVLIPTRPRLLLLVSVEQALTSQISMKVSKLSVIEFIMVEAGLLTLLL